MEPTYWHKQTPAKPLFPDLLWSRPENRSAAGKLLIIGGNLHGFAAPAEAYAAATRAGIGTARVLLPDAVKKLVGPLIENGEFAPSTPSGSFGQQALAEFLDHSTWADATLLAGDFGRNSETAIALEQFVVKSSARLTVTQDVVDYFKLIPEKLLDRHGTVIVLSLAQLQKLALSAHFPVAITFGMDLLKLVECLHELSASHAAAIVVKHLDNLLVAYSGQVSTTRLVTDMPVGRVKTAATASVWWLQNPSKSFESLTVGLTSMSGDMVN